MSVEMKTTDEKPHETICKWMPAHRNSPEPDVTLFHEHQATKEGVRRGPYVIVADVPNFPQYCYLSDAHTAGPVGDDWKVGSQFFVALKRNLRPQPDPKTREDWPIHPNALDAISEVREKIKSGTHKIVNTRLVAV